MARERTLDQLQKLPTTIDREVVFVGNLQGRDNYIVHGRVVGDSDVAGMIMLGPQSHWKGNVVADVIVVRGEVEGNITARTKLEIRPTARIAGDIAGPVIAIAEGASVSGRMPNDSHVTRFIERRQR